jgi:SAM-dependent methyltransferase
LPSGKPLVSDAAWWVRFADEAAACPACHSPRIRRLDAMAIPRDAQRRRVAFIAGCDACGLLFTDPLPSAEQLERYYAEDGPWAASHADRVRKVERTHRRRLRETTPKPRPPRMRDRLVDALAAYLPVPGVPPGAKVLDFGCGDGKFLDRLQDRGWQTYGIEPSSDVAFLRHRRLTEPPQDGSFDFVLLHHVLEHVRQPLDVLERLAGALRDGGLLFVSVPRLDTLPMHQDLKYCLDGRKHLMSFSQVCLTGLLARAGLSVVGDLHTRELDDALSEGQPLRLRMVARRTSAALPLPPAPLRAAASALHGYALAHGGISARARFWLPVRFRAALLDRQRERGRRRVPSRAA